MPTLDHERVVAIVNHDELAEEVIWALGRAGRVSARGGEGGQDAADRFAALVEEITLHAASHPRRRDDLLDLLREDWDRPKEVLVRRLEFIRSQLIAKFKGLIAELLAVRVCSELISEWVRKGELPPSTNLYTGFSLLERERSGRTWKKGADGLVAREDGGRLIIYGIIEIKGYRRSAASVRTQLASHLARLRWGLRIGEREWEPEQMFVAIRKGGEWEFHSACRPSTADVRPILVLVSPQPLRPPAEPDERREGKASRHVRLPVIEEFLTEAAYNMVWWSVGQLGQRLSDPPAPDAEEAAINALKQSLYYMGLRDLPERVRSVAAGLYNVLGFGFAASQENPERDEIQWVEEKSCVDVAFRLYRSGRLAEARDEIEARLASELSEAESIRLRWLRGMVHYVSGEFEQAADAFLVRPGPSPCAADDHLVLALILARVGKWREAAGHIEQVSALDLEYECVRVRRGISRALAAERSGDREEALRHIEFARLALQARRQVIGERLKAHLGLDEPFQLTEFDVSALTIEAAAVYGMLGDAEAAACLIQTVGPVVLTPYLLLLAKDPALEAVWRDEGLGRAVREHVDGLIRRDREWWSGR